MNSPQITQIDTDSILLIIRLINLCESVLSVVSLIHSFSEMNKFRQQVYVICLEVTLLIR